MKILLVERFPVPKYCFRFTKRGVHGRNLQQWKRGRVSNAQQQ